MFDKTQKDNHGRTCIEIYTLAVSTASTECLTADPEAMQQIEAHSIKGEVDPVTLANHADSVHFTCTGQVQTWTVPSGGTYNVWLSGGGGGFGSVKHDPNEGGAAGFTWGVLDLSSGDQLNIYVGCAQRTLHIPELRP